MAKKYTPKENESRTKEENELLELALKHVHLLNAVKNSKQEIDDALLLIPELSLEFIRLAKQHYPTIINGTSLRKKAGQEKIEYAMGDKEVDCYGRCGRTVKVSYSKNSADYLDVCQECKDKREREDEEESKKARHLRVERMKYLHSLRTMPYMAYLQTEHWKTLRIEKLRRALWRCELCGEKGWSKLHVHHKHYETRGEEKLADLIVLCENCHAKHHNKIGRTHKIPDKVEGKMF